MSAQAEVAQRLESLIVARTLVREAEDQLRVLIMDPKRADYWFVRLEPADTIPPIGPSPDVDAAVRNALTQRTDLERPRSRSQIADTNVTLAKNGTLPDLRRPGVVSHQRPRRHGTHRATASSARSWASSLSPYGDVLRQMFVADYPTWTVGRHDELSARVAVPTRPKYARTTLERDQSQERLRSAEFKVVREVRQAALQLDQNRQRIDTTRLARELSEQRLDAEQKRFEVGMSTNFNVIQAQRDLAVARNSELQAQLDFQVAWITFETVQRVGTTTLPARPRRLADDLGLHVHRDHDGRVDSSPTRRPRRRRPTRSSLD